MGTIYTSVEQLIGGTPLLELRQIQRAEGLNATLLAKLEYLNPAGSAKDRVAKAMLDDAEAKGLLKPGAVSYTHLPAEYRTEPSVSERYPARPGRCLSDIPVLVPIQRVPGNNTLSWRPR